MNVTSGVPRIKGTRVTSCLCMTESTFCTLVPQAPKDTKSRYNLVCGSYLAKTLDDRMGLLVVHLDLDGSCLPGRRGGQGLLVGERDPHILLDCAACQRRISTVDRAHDPTRLRDGAPLSDRQTDSRWSRNRVCSRQHSLHRGLREPPLDFNATLEFSCSKVRTTLVARFGYRFLRFCRDNLELHHCSDGRACFRVL